MIALIDSFLSAKDGGYNWPLQLRIQISKAKLSLKVTFGKPSGSIADDYLPRCFI
jgi:hypothetical protein